MMSVIELYELLSDIIDKGNDNAEIVVELIGSEGTKNPIQLTEFNQCIWPSAEGGQVILYIDIDS